MSKYEKRGAYHYAEFADPKSIYRAHVLDLVDRVMEHVNKKLLLPTVVEIGAGEGLILDQFSRQGLSCRGCDIDATAVRLAKEKGNRVELGSIELFTDQRFDVVLLCDVLEHVKHPLAMLAAACTLSRGLVVVAVPDREDKHAIHAIDLVGVETGLPGWECLHRAQRHARWFGIFER
jgi:2-polyprenyl-3-methyl-5-hydroxy-6-metoxy-1,4-benzoquinol methylase